MIQRPNKPMAISGYDSINKKGNIKITKNNIIFTNITS